MATYKLIASTTVSSGTATSLSFTNIPQTYTDLLLWYSIRSTTNQGAPWWTAKVFLNNTFYSGSGTLTRQLAAFGTTLGSDTMSNESVSNVTGNTATGSVFSNGQLYFTNYTSSDRKGYILDQGIGNGGGQALTSLVGCCTNLTSAITDIKLQDYSGNSTFVQYSTAYLYGVYKG